MTPRQVRVLGMCIKKTNSYKLCDVVFDGLSANYAQQAGLLRQVRWLLEHGLIYVRGGRYYANASGRRVYEHPGELVTKRVPQGKRASTIAGKALMAIANDLQTGIDKLRELAGEYLNHDIVDPKLEERAAMVDVVLDDIAWKTRDEIWPRAWHYRVEYHRAPNFRVIGSVPLGPAQHVVVVCRMLCVAKEDIMQTTRRNPDDRRITYVNDLDSCRRIAGMDHHTPYYIHSWPDADSDQIRMELKVRLGQPTKSLAELISLIDWRTPREQRTRTDSSSNANRTESRHFD